MLLPTLSVLFASTLALAAKKVAATEANNPDSSAGKTLYITSPACGFYKCEVTWPKGLQVTINWLEPTTGNVSVSLVSNVGGPTYTIVDSMPGTTHNCDAGGGVGVVVSGASCGSVDFIVPNSWANSANNTIMVQSLSNASDVGYTDAIVITAANATTQSSTVASVSVIGSAVSTSGSSASSAAVLGATSSTKSASATSAGASSASASKSGTSAATAASAMGSTSASERLGASALLATLLVGLATIA